MIWLDPFGVNPWSHLFPQEPVQLPSPSFRFAVGGHTSRAFSHEDIVRLARDRFVISR